MYGSIGTNGAVEATASDLIVAIVVYLILLLPGLTNCEFGFNLSGLPDFDETRT